MHVLFGRRHGRPRARPRVKVQHSCGMLPHARARLRENDYHGGQAEQPLQQALQVGHCCSCT